MRSTLLTLAAVTALTACGGGTATDTDAGPTTGAPAPTTTSAAPTSAATTPPVTLTGTVDDRGTEDIGTATALTLDLGDFYFAPTYVVADPGTKLAITLENTGKAPHTFTALDPRVDVTVGAGGKGTASVTLPASGTVAFYCRFHRAQGMQGGFAVS